MTRQAPRGLLMETAGRHFHGRHLVGRPFSCECDWKDRLDVVVHLELGNLTLLHPRATVFEFRTWLHAQPVLDRRRKFELMDGATLFVTANSLLAVPPQLVRNDVNFEGGGAGFFRFSGCFCVDSVLQILTPCTRRSSTLLVDEIVLGRACSVCHARKLVPVRIPKMPFHLESLGPKSPRSAFVWVLV